MEEEYFLVKTVDKQTFETSSKEEAEKIAKNTKSASVRRYSLLEEGKDPKIFIEFFQYHHGELVPAPKNIDPFRIASYCLDKEDIRILRKTGLIKKLS